MEGISASGALAYDAVQILDAAFKKILKDKPLHFNNDRKFGRFNSHRNLFASTNDFARKNFNRTWTSHLQSLADFVQGGVIGFLENHL